MANFSNKSNSILNTCDARIQRVFREVVKVFDCSVISGLRLKEEQDELFRTGKSQRKWPDSYHNNVNPDKLSKAVDAVPFPVNWNDRERFTLFAGFVIAIGHSMGYTITWGGDWNRDFKVGDNKFDDFAHFQIED